MPISFEEAAPETSKGISFEDASPLPEKLSFEDANPHAEVIDTGPVLSGISNVSEPTGKPTVTETGNTDEAINDWLVKPITHPVRTLSNGLHAIQQLVGLIPKDQPPPDVDKPLLTFEGTSSTSRLDNFIGELGAAFERGVTVNPEGGETGSKVAQGAGDAAKEMAVSMSTPEMVGQLAAGAGIPNAGKVVAAKFLTEMAASAPDQAAEFGTKLAEGDHRGASKAFFNYAISTLAPLGVVHAVEKPTEVARLEQANAPQTAQAVADTAPLVNAGEKPGQVTTTPEKPTTPVIAAPADTVKPEETQIQRAPIDLSPFAQWTHDPEVNKALATLAEALKPKETPVKETGVLPDYDPNDIGMRARLNAKKAGGMSHEQAVDSTADEHRSVEDYIAALPVGTLVRHKSGQLYEKFEDGWNEVNQKTGDTVPGSVIGSQNLRGGKVERLGKKTDQSQVKPTPLNQNVPTEENVNLPAKETPAVSANENENLGVESKTRMDIEPNKGLTQKAGGQSATPNEAGRKRFFGDSSVGRKSLELEMKRDANSNGLLFRFREASINGVKYLFVERDRQGWGRGKQYEIRDPHGNIVPGFFNKEKNQSTSANLDVKNIKELIEKFKIRAEDSANEIRDSFFYDSIKSSEANPSTPIPAVTAAPKPEPTVSAKNAQDEIGNRIDELVAIGEARRKAASLENQGLRPSPSDWLTESEQSELHKLQQSLPSAGQIRAEAQARLNAKRKPPESTEAQKPDLISMGGLAPKDPLEPVGKDTPTEGGHGGDIYGIAQRVREKRAKAGQVMPIEPGQGVSAEETIAWGRDLLENGVDAEKALQQFEKDKKTSYDLVAVTRAKGEEIAKAARSIESKFGTDSNEFKTAQKALNDWDRRTKPIATEAHKQFVSFQGETDIDTGSFSGLQRAFNDITGKDFTESQAETAKKTAKEVGQSDKDVEGAKPKLEKAIQNIGVEPHVKLIADKLKDYFDNRAKSALDRIKARRAEGRLFTGIDPTELADYADYGASKILTKGIEGAEMTAEWAKEMKDEIGEYIGPHLKQIWDESKKVFEAGFKQIAGVGETAKKVRPAKAKPAETIESAKKGFAGYEAGKPFTNDQLKTLWRRVKDYIDKGIDSMPEIVNKVAADLGLDSKDVLRGLNQNKAVKKVADDVWQKQKKSRVLKSAAKRWLEDAQKTWLQKSLPTSARLMFAAKTGFHGTVALGTHAPLTLATNPIIFANNFGKMYKLVFSPEYYEMQAHDMYSRPNYNVANRYGLVNDMAKMEDFNDPKLAQGFPKFAEYMKEKLGIFKGVVGAGTRGYSVLKIIRQDLFDEHWNKLAESEQTPAMAAAIADSVNHMTGVVKAGVNSKANLAMFAPKLFLSRLAVGPGDLFRAGNSLLKMSDMTPEERWFAKNQFKEKSKIASVAMGLLLANQTLNNFLGDKRKINGVPEFLGGGGMNPMESDFMKFKVAGMNYAWASPFLTMARLPLRIIRIGMGDGGKAKNLIYPDESMSYEVFKYARTQESPALSPLVSLVTKADFQGRPLPQIPGYGKPPPMPKRLKLQGVQPYTWTEFAIETVAPIPIEEGVREIAHNMGVDNHHKKSASEAIITILIMAATGGRLTSDWKENK